MASLVLASCYTDCRHSRDASQSPVGRNVVKSSIFDDDIDHVNHSISLISPCQGAVTKLLRLIGISCHRHRLVAYYSQKWRTNIKPYVYQEAIILNKTTNQINEQKTSHKQKIHITWLSRQTPIKWKNTDRVNSKQKLRQNNTNNIA